ncbi:MAG: hypothetical protein KIT61_15385 [Pyrinomonadaceae bacterium]|nr:hypothetical protein [Blastocatellia bacterium]MCW5957968.1 hypothetical protein [Pyrinomonadaceae bacterium]
MIEGEETSVDCRSTSGTVGVKIVFSSAGICLGWLAVVGSVKDDDGCWTSADRTALDLVGSCVLLSEPKKVPKANIVERAPSKTTVLGNRSNFRFSNAHTSQNLRLVSRFQSILWIGSPQLQQKFGL